MVMTSLYRYFFLVESRYFNNSQAFHNIQKQNTEPFDIYTIIYTRQTSKN